jgi:hypothetical protein
MDIFLRPPSASWEPVPLPDVPGAAVWAWFRPPSVPYGIVFQIPPDTHTAHPDAFTIRRLLGALNIDCKSTRMCFACAEPFDSMQGMNPLLDRPVCPPAPGVPPTVAVHFTPPTQYSPAMAPVRTGPVVTGYSCPTRASGSSESLYHAIESDWHAIQLLESKNLSLRKQLNSMLTKLMGLNRDLTPEERNASDALDHRDWQEARRWIRDGAAMLSRVVRAHDIGVTSSAGNRNKFDDIIAFYVTPRRPLENLAALQHQFEVHRKTVQSLHTEMHNAMHGPGQEGEHKAHAVLSRIRVKVQAARGKR